MTTHLNKDIYLFTIGLLLNLFSHSFSLLFIDGLSPEAVKDFVEKVLAVKDLRHPNVLTPLGVVLQPSSTPQVVMPYMKYKELNKFLRQEQDLSSMQILNLGCQVAKAMDYLATKDCVHKNLTSSHCMVSESYQVKVIYNNQDPKSSEDCKKWLAPECLNNSIFSQKSDVWSFGVILWEMASAGQVPYQHQDSLLEYLLSGNRLPQPENCSDELFSIMMHCWSLSPQDRPTFSWLVERLSTMHQKLKQENTEDMSIETVC